MFELNLSFNKIKKIDFLKNIPFIEIEIMSFRENKIIDIGVFNESKIYCLQETDLSENEINNIEVFNNEEIFSSIKYINLRDNDIDIDIEDEKNKIIIEKFKNKIEIKL